MASDQDLHEPDAVADDERHAAPEDPVSDEGMSDDVAPEEPAADDTSTDDVGHAASPDAARRVRRGSGERARRRREARRARRWRLVRRGLQGLVLLAALAALVWVVVRFGVPWIASLGEDAPAAAPEAPPEAAPSAAPGTDARPTVLVATFDDSGEVVTRVQLLQLDGDSERGAVVLLPTTMVADVPGYGLLPIGDAGAFGGTPLLELTVENQLGVAVDATVRLTEQDWAALFARTGGFEVDVARPLAVPGTDGTPVRRFEPGPQFLDGPRLAELLTIEVEGEDELTSFARVRQVLEGFLATAEQEGGLDALFADGAPMLTTTEPDVVERVLRGLAGPETADRVVLRTLPVTVMGSGDSTFYRLDDERAGAFVEEVLGGTEAVPEGSSDGVQLEILNGNGQAGIGAEVASLLVPLGHTVAMTRNAENFDHPTTRVLIYGDDDELVAAAQEIVDALGVGRIEVSEVPSSIVDITVLVGADFRG